MSKLKEKGNSNCITITAKYTKVITKIEINAKKVGKEIYQFLKKVLGTIQIYYMRWSHIIFILSEVYVHKTQLPGNDSLLD